MGARHTFFLPILLLSCSGDGVADSSNGYEQLNPKQSAAVRGAMSAWQDCIVYGIGKVDVPGEPAVTIAEAAMAGCIRAETNLEDRLFDSMKGRDDPREVRAMAHDMVEGFRVRVRSTAVRLVLSKHQEDAAKGRERLSEPQ